MANKVFMSSDSIDAEILVKMPIGHISAKLIKTAHDPNLIIECNGKEIIKFISDDECTVKVIFSDGLIDIKEKGVYLNMVDNVLCTCDKEEN